MNEPPANSRFPQCFAPQQLRVRKPPSTGGRLRPGQHAVITGGSSGLGLELAGQLARRGISVTLFARDLNRLERAREHITGLAPAADVRVASVDVTDPTATHAAFDEVAAAAGTIDVLINSAGILREGYFERLGHDDFRQLMDTNFFGVVNATAACLPHLKKSRGRIVNVGSLAGLVGTFGLTAYGAAKYALTGFSAALRVELEPQCIAVQLVCPAEFDSPMVDLLNTYRTPENRAHSQSVPVLPISRVASETIRGIDTGDHLIIPGAAIRLAWRVSRFAPGLIHRYFQRRLASVYQGPDGGSRRPVCSPT